MWWAYKPNQLYHQQGQPQLIALRALVMIQLRVRASTDELLLMMGWNENLTQFSF